MKRLKKRYLIPGLLVLVLGLALGTQVDDVFSGTDTYEQLHKLENAFLIISRQYVDEADPEELVEAAVYAMLEKLDPHSVYISSDEVEELQESYKGSFGGVGILFEVVKDTIRVISTVTGGPSEQAGVVAGDRIIAIGDTSAVGFSSTEVQKHLKGEIGTEVKMTIYRPSARKPLEFEVTRDRIPLYSIDASYMIDDQTGYIKIGRFAMTTYREFREKLDELRGQGMERLVLDLRYNGGGIMESAERIADEFIDGGKTLVYTKGRNPHFDKRVRSTNGGTFEDQPVIVMVNEYSASASEIVAGALQDHDRALIVGRQTFGKGLVQSQFQLPDKSVLQMTISRYYTPSGRLIQTPYEGGDLDTYYEEKSFTRGLTSSDEYMGRLPDSLKYRTTHDRVVFGGGGILPDYLIPGDTLSSPVLSMVLANSYDQLFAREWFEGREGEYRTNWGSRQQEFIDSYEVDDEIWNAFWAFLSEKEISVTSTDADVLPESNIYAMEDVEKNRLTIETRLKALIARQLYGAGVWHPIVNQIDPELEEALGLWNQSEDLALLHR